MNISFSDVIVALLLGLLTCICASGAEERILGDMAKENVTETALLGFISIGSEK